MRPPKRQEQILMRRIDKKSLFNRLWRQEQTIQKKTCELCCLHYTKSTAYHRIGLNPVRQVQVYQTFNRRRQTCARRRLLESHPLLVFRRSRSQNDKGEWLEHITSSNPYYKLVFHCYSKISNVPKIRIDA